jgi:hypothetical protein
MRTKHGDVDYARIKSNVVANHPAVLSQRRVGRLDKPIGRAQGHKGKESQQSSKEDGNADEDPLRYGAFHNSPVYRAGTSGQNLSVVADCFVTAPPTPLAKCFCDPLTDSALLRNAAYPALPPTVASNTFPNGICR